MKRVIGLVCMGLLVLASSGCGSKADSLTTDAIANTNNLAEAFETGAPSSRVEEIYKRQDETKKRMEELRLSEDEKKQLLEKHKAAIEPATERLMDAIKKRSIKETNDLADAYKNNATSEKKKEIADARDELKKRLDELKLSDDQKKNLDEKFKKEVAEAEERLKNAMQ
jgi:hypothetical protein